jgi:lysophospholipase L1-like esterase
VTARAGVPIRVRLPLILLVAGAGALAVSAAARQADPARASLNGQNEIEDRAGAFIPLYAKLRAVSEAGKGRVVILHVGDSHVQAGFFADAVRMALGRVFGDAGHGLVLPKYRKNVGTRKRPHYVLATVEQPEITEYREFAPIALRDADPSEGFDRMVFVHEKGTQYLDFEVLDPNNNRLATVRSSSTEASPYTTTVTLPQLYRTVRLRTARTSPTERYVQLYGVSLENERAGIVYHSYGVIGAATENFVQSIPFRRELETLHPDAVIVSLGTNDAFAPLFDAETYAANLERIVADIRSTCPQAAVLLTTAPDSYRRASRVSRRAPNPNVPVAGRVVLGVGGRLGCATWDLFSIMGGSGTVGSWQKRGLAGRDLVHFTKDGYQLQGTWFSEAFLSGFRRYATSQSGETAAGDPVPAR